MQSPAGSPGARLVGAMTAHPEYVSGTTRAERDLMQAFPGLVAKSGAESVYVVGLPDGSAYAIKIEDGGERPLYAVDGPGPRAGRSGRADPPGASRGPRRRQARRRGQNHVLTCGDACD